ncbi:MAG: DUF512 domain-containing protein [Eubacteriales bacterium]|nr:DUF512 domain-containing protein [Eubacteriales bacterium]
MVTISSVEQGSQAARRGIKAGEIILSINGEKVIDNIDYQALTAERHVCLVLQKKDGSAREVDIIKSADAALGITLANDALSSPRLCANNCVFCFVDQMPPGMRASLYVKDDDWRYSLMMGNFITLTNVGEAEFRRILQRKPSPLYISVHATGSNDRISILNNPNAGNIMERLRRLKAEEIRFHCQVVLCPGLNDGNVLRNTLKDLYSLRPAALSVALVPVGLTRFRDNLPAVKTFDREKAEEVIALCEEYQQYSVKEYGDYFAYPADELISIASLQPPAAIAYDNYPQLENGIGMLRLFEDSMRAERASGSGISNSARTVCIPCGTSLAPYMDEWLRSYAPQNVKTILVPIINTFFGSTVTVSGLITAGDLLAQLKDVQADEIFICETMLNDDLTMFLDDVAFADFEKQMGIPCTIIKNKGEEFYRSLLGA